MQKKKVVLINAKEYFPQRGGDIINSYGLLKELHQATELHLINILDNVSYSVADIENIKQNSQTTCILKDEFYANSFSLLKSYVTLQPFFSSRRSRRTILTREIKSLVEHIDPEIIIWDHMRSTSYFFNNSKKNVLFEHNDEVTIYRQKEKLYPLLLRPLLKLQTFFLKKHNLNIHNQSDWIVYVSEKDINQPNKEKKRHLSFMMADFASPTIQIKNESPIVLIFAGALDWFPNVKGIEWFIDEVMCKLGDHFKLLIVGKQPSKSFLRKIKDHNNVELHANVPSMQPYYEKSDIFISPIKIGSGINIKMLEACSYSIPSVVTSFSKKGYEGLEFLPTADSPEEFIENLNSLKSTLVRKGLQEKISVWYSNYKKRKSENIQAVFLSETYSNQ